MRVCAEDAQRMYTRTIRRRSGGRKPMEGRRAYRWHAPSTVEKKGGSPLSIVSSSVPSDHTSAARSSAAGTSSLRPCSSGASSARTGRKRTILALASGGGRVKPTSLASS